MPPADASLHDAVSHLYQDHHGWLQGWLRRRLGCAENAADLAQDTFARRPGLEQWQYFHSS
ncbi:sigma factor, partial [Pseudomonas aeruginosa]|uniref:sigma factor n=1 Tax=Pseudomonas aeruginosa TaxID=287 RepID=UPI00066D3E67